MRRRKFRFDIAHRVVTKVTNEAADKTQIFFHRRGHDARFVAIDKRQRIFGLVFFYDCAVVQNLYLLAVHAQHLARGQTDDGIAAEAFAADDGFEQIGIRLVGELEINRQRCVEIDQGFERDGDAVKTLRRERDEFLFSHDGSLTGKAKKKMAKTVIPDYHRQQPVILLSVCNILIILNNFSVS